MPQRYHALGEYNVSRHGFWLLLDAEDLLVRFSDFPWFRQATIDALTQVERPSPDHLYWPQLDVDLSVRSLRSPADFPLVSRAPLSDGGACDGPSR